MREGGTYIVQCERKGRRYDVWLSGQPDVRASGSALEEALDDLYFCVMEWNGDGEAVFEMMSGPWEGRTSGVGYSVLGWNEGELVENQVKDLFQEGACPRCRHGLGGRSSEVLELTHRPMSDVFRAQGHWPDEVYPCVLIVSERFVDLLEDSERSLLGLRPVDVPAGVRKRFFEIAGDPVASMVGFKGAEYALSLGQSWRCSACGSANFSFKEAGRRYVSRSAFGAQLPEVFMFNELASVGSVPAFSRSRWQRLLKSAKGVKGVCSSRVEIIPESMVDADPVLPDYEP